MSGKTKNVIGKTGEMRPFNYKKVYLIEVEKAGKGIYNFKVYFEEGVILEEDNLKQPTMYKVGDYIRTKIDAYEVEEGIETPEKVDEKEAEVEEELDELEEVEEEVDLLLDEEEDNGIETDDELAQAQFKKETGMNYLTKKGTVNKGYKKWKKNNWD